MSCGSVGNRAGCRKVADLPYRWNVESMPSFSAIDNAHMARALELAARGLYTAHPNPRVGCVLVRDDVVIGEGFHRRAGESHAEIEALRSVGGSARDSTAYVSLEPCCHHGRTPPCTEALIAAGIKRVIAAMADPNPRVAGQGLRALETAGIKTGVGLLEAEARSLNRGFVARMSRGRPWLRIKSAMSLDGRTAMANGASRWITGEAARRDVQRLRARSGAILTGSGTILADDPALNVRITADELGALAQLDQPLRAVFDTHLRTNPDAQWLRLSGDRLLFTAAGNDHRRQQFIAAGVEIIDIPETHSGLDLNAALNFLATREINEVQVEAGPALTGALISAGLADEIVVYMAPHLMGDAARGFATLPGIENMEQRCVLKIAEIRQLDEDLRITAYPTKSS